MRIIEKELIKENKKLKKMVLQLEEKLKKERESRKEQASEAHRRSLFHQEYINDSMF